VEAQDKGLQQLMVELEEQEALAAVEEDLETSKEQEILVALEVHLEDLEPKE
jgi:hypothetical protein